MLQYFTNLEELDIKVSIQSDYEIEANSFDTLRNLRSLSLEWVQIIPEFLFMNLIKLEELSILKCHGLKLNTNHFHGLDNLKSLNFHGQFDGEIENLPNLRKLTLRVFKFKNFTSKGLEKLEELNFKEVQTTENDDKKLFKNSKSLKNIRTTYNFPYMSKSEINSMTEIFQSLPTNVKHFCCTCDIFEALNSNLTPFIYELESLRLRVIKEMDYEDYFLFKDNLFQNLKEICLSDEYLFGKETQTFQRMRDLKILKNLNIFTVNRVNLLDTVKSE